MRRKKDQTEKYSVYSIHVFIIRESGTGKKKKTKQTFQDGYRFLCQCSFAVQDPQTSARTTRMRTVSNRDVN